MLLKILIGMAIVWLGMVVLGLAFGWGNHAAKKWLTPLQYDTLQFWFVAAVVAAVIIYALFFAGPIYSHRM